MRGQENILTYFAKILGLDICEFGFLNWSALWNFVNFVKP